MKGYLVFFLLGIFSFQSAEGQRRLEGNYCITERFDFYHYDCFNLHLDGTFEYSLWKSPGLYRGTGKYSVKRKFISFVFMDYPPENYTSYSIKDTDNIGDTIIYYFKISDAHDDLPIQSAKVTFKDSNGIKILEKKSDYEGNIKVNILKNHLPHSVEIGYESYETISILISDLNSKDFTVALNSEKANIYPFGEVWKFKIKKIKKGKFKLKRYPLNPLMTYKLVKD